MDRRSRLTASILAGLAAITAWLSAGTSVVSGGDATRIAALPSIWWLAALLAIALAAAWAAPLRREQAWPLAISVLLALPFVPGIVPPAFLLWQGPVRWFVWALVAGGLVAARPPRFVAAISRPSTAPFIAAAVVATASLIVFTQVRDVVPGGDEPHYLAATQSVLKDADLRVANNYAAGDYLQYFPGRLDPHFLKRSTTGDIYSIHAPGVSLIVLPAFAVAGYPGAVLTMVLFAGLAAALAWRVSWRLSNSVAGAWIGVLAVFMTAPYFFHSFTIYPEIIGSFCVLCGAWLLLELDDGRDVGASVLCAVGTALAVLPWLHSRFAVIAFLIGVFVVARLLARANGWKHAAVFAAVPAVAAAGWFAYFWTIWGSPSPAAPYGADTSTSASYILRGVIGLLVDQQYGVIATAPVYLSAAMGAFLLLRRRTRLTIELAAVVIAYAIAVASYAMWWAGSAAPARFLVAILPLAAPAIAAAAGTLTTIGLLASIALIVPRAFVEGGRLIFTTRSTFDATIEWVGRAVDLTMALPSVHRDGGSVALRDAAVWVAVLTVVAVAIARRRASRPSRWVAAAMGTAAAMMIAATLVWSWHGAAPLTPDRAKLSAFAGLRPWHTTLVDLTHARMLREEEFLHALSIQIPPGAARVNRLPAGEYRVTPAGAWRMQLSRNDQPIAIAGERLRLPVMLQSPTLQTEGVALTPLMPLLPPVSRNAVHAAQYGSATAFFFDEHAYAERDGFWTRAYDRATVVIDGGAADHSSGLALAVRAGAVPTTIELSSGGWRQSLSLDGGEQQELVVPPADRNTWALSIRSGAGFRPSEREPGNRDVRLLSAWIAIR